jgi:hypothetical protein
MVLLSWENALPAARRRDIKRTDILLIFICRLFLFSGSVPAFFQAGKDIFSFVIVDLE